MAKRSNPVMSYIPGKSVIHALTGTTKLVFFLLFTFSSMLTYDTRVLLGLMVISFSCFAVSHIKFKDVSFVFWFMVVFLALNNFFIFLFSPDQGTELYGTRVVLCHLFGPYDLTREQLFYHFNISLKYFVALPIALLFITATNPSEFASSLNAVGVSYRIGYSVALALRYIPDIQRDYRNISTAQQARGVELGKKVKLHKRVKNSISVLMPLIMSSLSRIEAISNAMELRGFGKEKKRTWYVQRKFSSRDYIAIAFGAVILTASLIITFHDGNRFWNPSCKGSIKTPSKRPSESASEGRFFRWKNKTTSYAGGS